MAGFGNALASMDASIMRSLNDGKGEFRPADGRRPVECLELIVDFNLEQQGAGGVFISEAVGISCRKCEVGKVERGDLFIFNRCRYVVEVLIADDGHMLTAACMVQP